MFVHRSGALSVTIAVKIASSELPDAGIVFHSTSMSGRTVFHSSRITFQNCSWYMLGAVHKVIFAAISGVTIIQTRINVSIILFILHTSIYFSYCMNAEVFFLFYLQLSLFMNVVCKEIFTG